MNHDIFFLSYSESNADTNWTTLQTLAPGARRLHGISGVKNAHQKIAETASSDFFFVIDGDNEVYNNFDFSVPAQLENDTLYVWRAHNPVNDLCYGFGGIKLYNKWLLLENTKPTSVDIATSIAPKYVPVPVVASTTHFNSTPLESWRGAFRESAKLTLSILKNPNDIASQNRLKIWCSMGKDRKNGGDCLRGANLGFDYANAFHKDPLALARINDFEWLDERFSTQL